MEFGEVGRGNGMTTPAAEKVRGRKVVVRVTVVLRVMVEGKRNKGKRK